MADEKPKVSEEQKRAVIDQIKKLKAEGRWDENSKLEVVKYLKTGAAPTAAAEPEKSPLGKAADIALRALDYTGGIGRTAVGNLIPNAATGEDFKKALKGQAPSSAEMLERAGYGSGGSLSDAIPGIYSDDGEEWLKLKKGGVADPTARGAAGFALDTLADPMTYAGGFLAKQALKQTGNLGRALKTANVVLNPVDALAQGAQAGGKSIYKSAFKAADRMAEKFGKNAPSELLWNAGVRGTASSVERQVGGMIDKLLENRNAVLKRADEAGASVDVDAALAPIKKNIDDLLATKDPVKVSIAQAMQRKIKPYEALRATPDQVIKEGFGEQGGLFRELELPQAQTRTQLASDIDAPLKGRYTGQAQQVGMPESAMASKQIPDNMSQAFASGASSKQVSMLNGGEMVPYGTRASDAQQTLFGVEPQSLEALKGVPTGPSQQDLLSEAATLSEGISPTNIYREAVLEGKIAPGQQHLFTPGELLPKVKETIIPGVKAPNASQASGIKSSIYDMIGGPSFQQAKNTDAGKGLLKDLGRGWKDATEQAVESSLGEGAVLRGMNEELGDLLTTRKAFLKDADKEINRNALTSIDGMLLGLASPAAFAAKKAADITKTTWFRTNAGKGINKLGEKTAKANKGNALDALARRVGSENKDQDPTLTWSAILAFEEEKKRREREQAAR